MSDGNTHAIAQHLADQEEWDELQEVTAALEQAQDRIEELEAKLITTEEIGRAFEQDAGQLRDKLAKAVKFLSCAIDMTGEPHCYHDHHGYCQAHNLEPKGECWVEQSQAFIAELTGGKDE